MDIKLVRNFEDGDYSSLNEELLLQILDDNKTLNGFRGKKYFLFNPYTGGRLEIAPEIQKFNLAAVQYAEQRRNYIIFTSAAYINESDIEIAFYWYDAVSRKERIIHKQVVQAKTLACETGTELRIKVFVLSSEYCIFEIIHNTNGEKVFELLLTDVNNDKNLVIDNEQLCKSGIDKIAALSGNLCAVKIGDDIIGIVNVNQFVSDIVLGLEKLYIDVLDQSSEQFVLPYMRKCGDNLLYMRYDRVNNNEDIISYDYVNKIKKVRLNSVSVGETGLQNICIINNVLYNFVRDGESTFMVDLNTQKVEYEFLNDINIKYIAGDIIIVCRQAKTLPIFGKTVSCVEAYRFPDMKNSILKTRGEYKNSVVNFDDILLFIS